MGVSLRLWKYHLYQILVDSLLKNFNWFSNFTSVPAG